MIRYWYFVFYKFYSERRSFFWTSTEKGYGNASIVRNTPIDSMFAIKEIEEQIRQAHFDNNTRVVVEHFFPLKKEES